MKVEKRTIDEAEGTVEEPIRREAEEITYHRNARGMLIRRRWRDAWRLWRAAWRQAPSDSARRELIALIPFAAKRLVSVAIGRG